MSSQPARAFRPLSACCPCFPCFLAPSVCFTFVSRLVSCLASCLFPSVPLSFPSCMLRCHRNLPALFACFPSCFPPFPVRSSFPPVPYVAMHRNLPALSVHFPPVARSSSSSRLRPPASQSALSSSFCPLSGLEGIQKKPSGIALGGLLTKNGGYLLSHGCAVPSARAGLTSLFGMGRGGTPPP